MTLFQIVESLQADVKVLQESAGVTPADVAAAIAPVEAKIDALAALVGTPSTPV